MIFKYLLTLLLLFVAPHETALAPVHSTSEGDDTWECSEDWYHYGDVDYYAWEDCLFSYSGNLDSTGRGPKLSREEHQTLFEQVWEDYMGDATPPRLRRGQAAIEDVCDPLDDDGQEWPLGCFDYEWEVCGPWHACISTDSTVAVKSNYERLLLHETAHAIYTYLGWDPYWGSGQWGSHEATGGHPLRFRCFLLDVYYRYTADVADDAYEMLNNVCEATGWD